MCSDQRMVTSLAFSSSRTRFSPNTKSSAGGAANTRDLTWGGGRRGRRATDAAGSGSTCQDAEDEGERTGRLVFADRGVMFDAHRRYGRNQPPIATLESYLAHFGFAQQHVLRLRLARHPVADIRIVVHREAARARPSARNSDAAADPIPIWVFSRTPRRDVQAKILERLDIRCQTVSKGRNVVLVKASVVNRAIVRTRRSRASSSLYPKPRVSHHTPRRVRPRHTR